MTFLASLTVAFISLLSLTARAELSWTVSTSKAQGLIRGQFILVDTRDEATCRDLQKTIAAAENLKSLTDLTDLCLHQDKQPIASILIAHSVPQDILQKELKSLTPEQKIVFDDTRSFALDQGNSDGLFYVVSRSIHEWKKSSVSSKSSKGFYTVQRHGPNTPLRDLRRSSLSMLFFWEQSSAARSSIETALMGSQRSWLFFELFRSLQNFLIPSPQQPLTAKDTSSMSMMVINPEADLTDTLSNAFNLRLSNRSRVRLLTRDPAKNVPTANPHDERSSSFADLEFDSREDKIHQTIDALQRYFIRDSYWGFEIQFKF